MSCTTANPWNISINFQTRRINEYSSTMMGSFSIGKEVPSISKIDAFTYDEKANGETVKKLSITYKNICRLMNEANIFLDPFFGGSDLPRQCPLKPGKYHLTNVTYTLNGEFTGVVPVGMHRAELHGFSDSSKAFCLRLVVELSTSNKRARS
ncbi:Protein of unknown function [Gryllus bimaculatus]|nr:Protein of unknown function [Gryllus bimaculatus]